jgi:hypothetical protein
LLSQYLLGLLASSDQVRHHCLSGAIRQILVDFKVFVHRELYCQLVREALQLGKSDPAVTDAKLRDLVLGDFDRVHVVASDQQQGVLGQVFHHELEVLIVAVVGLLERVPNW